MSANKQIVVTDWAKEKFFEGNFLKLTLDSAQRKILRGRRISDCNKILHLNLPRNGILNDGDILQTNQKNLFVEIIAKKENLLKISSNSKIKLVKASYHLGNRHIEVEIYDDAIFTKSDYIIEELLKNIKVDFSKTLRKFFPEAGAFNHE